MRSKKLSRTQADSKAQGSEQLTGKRYLSETLTLFLADLLIKQKAKRKGKHD